MNHKTMTHNTKHLLRAATLLAALLLPGAMQAQGTFDGVWYIANETNHSNADISKRWYLVPGADPQQPHYADAYFHNQYCNTSGSGDYTGSNYGDPEKPFLTTYQTNRDLNSIWIVVSTSDGYYNIIHAKTGRYIVYEPPYQAAKNRKSMHLESTSTPGENAKFAITGSLTGAINIRPKSVTSDNRFFNPAVGQGNYPRYYGMGDYLHEGMIGLYSGSTDKSQWYFENASTATALTPNISDVSASNTFTITSQAAAFSTIRYTTDGTTTPDASTGTTVTSGDDIAITSNITVKAVGVFDNTYVTPVAGPKALEPVPCATPVISFDNSTLEVSITCATESSSIYYTTNGNTPTTSSNPYSAPFSVDGPTTVKAIATHATLPSSAVAELAITQVATPTIQNNGSNAISITTATPGAIIYYTIDGSDPTTSSTEYIEPLTDNVSNVTIKAIAVKENMITSAVGSGTVKLQCATPVITRNGLTFTLSCSKPTDANLYYSFDGGSEVAYTGTPVSFSSDQLPITVYAVAKHSDYTNSETASFELINGSGTANDPYMIYGSTDLANFVSNVNNGTTSSAYYKLMADLSASGIGTVTTAFSGTFDGNGHTLTGLTHPLFNTVDGGVVKNVMLDDVTISSGTNVGAICGEATGDSRIYNCGVLATGSTVTTDEDGYTKIITCSSTIAGSNYVGGIVGLLDGTSRVINCFSYANVSGGAEVGGIVGHNNVTTTAAADNLKTMVMNCMFYGEVSGSSIAPIYNGNIITNVGNYGVSNFNYFRLEAAYIQNTDITKVYNCALGAETRFLQRFEFFRHLLNSNRELAAWWASTSSTAVTKGEIMKWVLEPTQTGTTTPYPILKTPGKYPSVVNIDAANAEENQPRNQGGKLGTLEVTIQMGGGGAVYGPPTGAAITNSDTTLIITDKDTAHYNFNYYKVQLPYYNEVGTKNYNGNRVVTGWKIVSITGGTPGTFTASDTWGGYNFADRHCTNKDLFSVSGRIFNQGAYWDVPEGVTAITIEPYWAQCTYLADAYADVVYNSSMETKYDVPNVGGGAIYSDNTSYTIAGENQVVRTTIDNAVTTLFNGVSESTSKNQTVYDYAIVLVGNAHYIGASSGNANRPFTVMSIDADHDNEPDYSYILRFNSRTEFHPVRADFINIPGLGMAQKSTGGTGSYNFGIMIPKRWFESTNTSLFRFTQFEYENSAKTTTDALILQGGVMEQWVSSNQKGTSNKIPYIHVGGNVWFKEFHTGCHQDKNISTLHSPISVTGGDYDEFYLTGLYVSCTTSHGDNAECYINGGRFGTVCGAAMEGIGKANGADNTGNITWQIQNADIKEFYAGALNAARPATGNLSTTITNSHVGLFCGGPKFGDMSANKTVVTNATGCTFGTFFGAGYGGNSYGRQAPRNHNSVVNFPHNDGEAGNDASWNAWLERFYKQEYNATYGGVSTQFNYQFLPMSGNANNVARIFVEYVKFSLATTRNVTSTLTNCTITGNFYGGGSLGKVEGNVTSILDSCTVQGSVFGAGYSASRPTVAVDSLGFRMEPYYYENLGTYRNGVKGVTTPYTWEHRNTVDKTSNAIDKTNHILYTTEDLSETNLGSVEGNAILTLQGTTRVDGNVYGGGDQSVVKGANKGNTTVILKGKANVLGNVYGGGNKGAVSGSSRVLIQDQEIQNN